MRGDLIRGGNCLSKNSKKREKLFLVKLSWRLVILRGIDGLGKLERCSLGCSYQQGTDKKGEEKWEKLGEVRQKVQKVFLWLLCSIFVSTIDHPSSVRERATDKLKFGNVSSPGHSQFLLQPIFAMHSVCFSTQPTSLLHFFLLLQSAWLQTVVSSGQVHLAWLIT